ncbi:Ccc1 family [Amanita rubescens]|nr:Ccc1 family [Amanita rubescens]
MAPLPLASTEKGRDSVLYESLLESQATNENHPDLGDIIRDITIGFADGLTVPFALTAGLSSLGSSKLVITGGLAELFSGAISMGLGAYLAAVTERDRYLSEEKRQREQVLTRPDAKKIYDLFAQYGISKEASGAIVDELSRDDDSWVKFMMDFELKLEKPNVSRAWISAGTMGLSYFIGGLLPMIPYFVIDNVTHALFVSIAVTFIVLVAFGFVKNYVTIKTKRAGFYGAVQTVIVGALAAGTSYAIVRGINHSNA